MTKNYVEVKWSGAKKNETEEWHFSYLAKV
jgi:hypothetical protein